MLRFALLLLLPFHGLLGSIIENERDLYSEAPMAAWVIPIDFPLAFETTDSHLKFLLIDCQEFWPEQTKYYHIAIKAFTQAGVEAIAQLEIDFEPAFQKLIVHEIKVYRNGVWIDKRNSRHELLQREEDLEENLVNGELTLIYFLEDIRPGDILEYTYSKIGKNPLFCSHYFNKMLLQASMPIGKISHRLLTYPEHVFRIRPFNTYIEPKITDLTESLREWRWEMLDPDICPKEELQPEWYQCEAYVEMSDYQGWGEVAEEFIPLFALPEDFDSNLPMEMSNTVASWKGTQLERALAALRFVQDEVRYLGFEEGIMGYKPHDPRIVFQCRFGDCKDKTFLLHALLHLMGIASTPVLVDTREGKLLPEMLPHPTVFNHIILQMAIDGVDYWVDPTISLQGGSLKDNFFPNYYWGLPLDKGANSLVALPEWTVAKPTEIDTQIKIISEDLAELSITWTAFGSKADGYRHYVQQVGLSNLLEESLNALQKKYGNASIHFPMAAMDDRENNIFILTESYFLPLRKRGNKSILNISSIIIRHFLETGFNPNRTAPYSLIYPLWVKEHIHIDNPFANWKEEEEDNNYTGSSVHYHYSSKIEGQSADFYHELKHLNDHIPLEEIQRYWDAAQEIEFYGSLDFKIQ
jgi:hypothetical protein